MTVLLSSFAGAGAQFFDGNGIPLSGGKIYTYLAGTNTPAYTYSTNSGLIPLSNPIILDSSGRVPTGEIWITRGTSYKFILKTAADVLVGTYDNIDAINDASLAPFIGWAGQVGTVESLASDDGASWIGYTPPYAGSVPESITDKLAQTVSVKDFGAVGNGIADDTLAIQTAIDWGAANSPCFIDFGNGSFFLGSTVYKSVINNVSLIGDGAKIISGTLTAIQLGDLSGSVINNIQVKGFVFTNNGSGGDALQILNASQCSIDITGNNVGGTLLRFGGDVNTSSGVGEWSTITLRSFDCGISFFGELLSSNSLNVVCRRAKQRGVWLQNCAQLQANITIDEVLIPVSPGTHDGVGVVAIDCNWSTLIGSVGIASKEALRLLGNCQWNTIIGEWYDSGTETNATYANILLDNNGGATSPKHNNFNVFAGWTGSASLNKPSYGIEQADGSQNNIVFIDSSGCASGVVSGLLFGTGNFNGPTSQRYYDFANNRVATPGINSFKIDIDTDNTAGGTPTYIVSQHDGAVNLVRVTQTQTLLPLVSSSSLPAPDSQNSCMWRDTLNSKTYLVFNDGISVKKVELT